MNGNRFEEKAYEVARFRIFEPLLKERNLYQTASTLVYIYRATAAGWFMGDGAEKQQRQ